MRRNLATGVELGRPNWLMVWIEKDGYRSRNTRQTAVYLKKIAIRRARRMSFSSMELLLHFSVQFI
jgi:hypothetical protein